MYLLFFVKYLNILFIRDLLKLSIKAPFMLELWVIWKFTPWRLRYCWSDALANSVPLSHCMVIGFLFWNKTLKLMWFRYRSCPLEARSKRTAKIFLWRLRGIVLIVVFREGASICKIHFPDFIDICYSIRIACEPFSDKLVQSVRALTWQPLFHIHFLFLLIFTTFVNEPNPAGCLGS